MKSKLSFSKVVIYLFTSLALLAVFFVPTLAASQFNPGDFIDVVQMTKEQRLGYENDLKLLQESFQKDQSKMKTLMQQYEKNPSSYNNMSDNDKQIVDYAKKVYKNDNQVNAASATNDNYSGMIPGYYFIGVQGSILGLGTGHVAIKGNKDRETVESYPEDGVRSRIDKWKGAHKFYKAMAIGSTSTRRTNAVNYANSKVNKPYNHNFWNKWTETSFYCSQLVWRAWYNQGIDIDNNKNDTIVTPVEVGLSSNTYKFEYKN